MQTGQSQRDAWRNARAVQIFETARVELKRLGLACYLGIDQPEPEAELGIVLRCASSAESLNLALVHAEVGIDYTNSAAGLTCVQGALAGQRVDAAITLAEFGLMTEGQQLAHLARKHVLPRDSTDRIALGVMTRTYQDQRLVLSGDHLLPGEDEVNDGRQSRRVWLAFQSMDSAGTWLHEAEIVLLEAELSRLISYLQHTREWLSEKGHSAVVASNSP